METSKRRDCDHQASAQLSSGSGWNGDLKKKGLRLQIKHIIIGGGWFDGMETSKRRDCDIKCKRNFKSFLPRWNGDLKKKGLRLLSNTTYSFFTPNDGMETSKRRDCDQVHRPQTLLRPSL